MTQVRRNLGVCPQHDILFPELTALQHLEVSSNIGNRSSELTTHFLDEADKLGDRVAIMAQGKLMCCGSPLFLKNRFGVGYTLTIVKEAHMKTGSDALAANHDIVKIDGLRKLYPANSRAGGVSINGLCFPPTKNNVKVAVQSLSFGIPRGECFGFLGINGAGKTTTLSILSGEFPPTAGNAFVDGFSIAVDQSKIRRKIGYCPQFDALLELLTVREHLELYGRIKGFQGALLEDIVAKKLDQLDLKDFENKTAGSLSGGNKRKLSVAVATVGDPPIVFLDEPSTGMDPK
jgi:ATP-binding cassette subfamily A (ABC1) protein 1